jgi:hypothetical protein
MTSVTYVGRISVGNAANNDIFSLQNWDSPLSYGGGTPSGRDHP